MVKVIVIIIAGALFAFYAYGIFEEAFGPAEQQTACTMDAKICPDGSAVGRSGPLCEFAQCPDVPESEVSPNVPPFDGGMPQDEIAPLPLQDNTAPLTPDPATEDEDMIMCTMDAMQCPDGSYVGRSGPNCQFVCP